jgi:hypothetical protein
LACPRAPSHQEQVGSRCRWPYHQNPWWACISNRPQPSRRRIRAGVQGKGPCWPCWGMRSTYLLGLALPPPLSLVWPSSRECGLPRVHHAGVAGVVSTVIPKTGLNGCDDSPAAVRRQAYVLLDRVVAIFPSSDSFVTQEAHGVIWEFRCGIKVEAGSGKLYTSSISNQAHAPSARRVQSTYVFGINPLVRPGKHLGRLALGGLLARYWLDRLE